MDFFVKVFKAFGEPTRIKILRLLSVRPMYVCELESVLDMSQPRISQHLRVLKEASLLKEAKEGQKTFYIVDWEIMDKAINGFGEFLKVDIEQLEEYKEICQRIKELENNERVIGCKTGPMAI